MSAADACAAFVAASCDFSLRCSPASFYEYYGTLAGCTAPRSAACMDRFVAPGVQLKPADLPACSESFMPTSCALLRPACQFRGTLADGTACAYDAQCTGGLCKLSGWFATCGVCGSTAAQGEACHQWLGCDEGLQCSLSGDTRDTCIGELAQGAACVASRADCADGLGCIGNVCQPSPRLNQACDVTTAGCLDTDDAECLKGVCQKLVWRAAGEDCDPGTGVLCLAGFECNPGGGPGVCQASTSTPQQFAADCK